MDAPFRLHHVGLLVKDIPTKAAQLVSRFGYRIDSAVIEDPTQTALVQFLRIPGADHWLELVAPNGAASKLSAALDRGAHGMHHLCYEVNDIAAACANLKAQAMIVIAPPVPAVAFGGRPIAWLLDRDKTLVELVESGAGPLALDHPL